MVSKLTPEQVAEQITDGVNDGQNYINCDYASRGLKVLDFGNEYYGIKYYYCECEDDAEYEYELYFIHNGKRYYYNDCLECDGGRYNIRNMSYE